jgi:hypothetical protein
MAQRKLDDPAYYGPWFLLAFVLSAVMLVTDKNLQNDFGAMSSGYYLHWYGVLAMAIIDLIGAILLFTVRSRLVLKLGVLVSGLFSLALVGVVFTYSQVGFASAGDFANYLFGITYYGGDIRYLYDLLLAVYAVTFLYGLLVLVLSRDREATPTPPTTTPANP